MNNLPIIHALWIGNKLGKLSRCCLVSFLMRGHEVYLHTYDEIEDIPEGIKCVDANEIILKNKIIKHNKTGSYALFSDIFRYELMKKVEGIYVDCDVYCLQPIHIPRHGYLLGFEHDKSINGAILKLPSTSITLKKLLNAAYDPWFIPQWYSKIKKYRLKIKKIFGLGRHLSDMPWGVIGPEAITYYISEDNLYNYVQPIDTFYPIHYQSISLLLDPSLNVSDITTSRTLAIHLYNEMLRDVDFENIDFNCTLAQLLRNEI